MRARHGRACAVVIVCGVLSGCGGGSVSTPPPEGERAGLELRQAEITEVPVRTEAVGTVEPWIRVWPGTKYLARVLEVRVREGDRVERGQVLARLEAESLGAAVAGTRAAAAEAEAHLQQAQAQHSRMQTLHERGSATDKNLEDATEGFRMAQAALERMRAGQAVAEVALADSEIRAPCPGIITERRVEPGDLAAPGAPLFRLDDLSRGKITVAVTESDLPGLAVGDAVEARVDAVDETFRAIVDRIVPSGDPATRTYSVQLVLDNPEGRLKPAMFVRASFESGTRQALLVPGSTLVERGQLRGLYVVGDDDLAILRWVQAIPAAPDAWEIVSGLAPGERFIVQPPPGLVEGTRVEPR